MFPRFSKLLQGQNKAKFTLFPPFPFNYLKTDETYILQTLVTIKSQLNACVQIKAAVKISYNSILLFLYNLINIICLNFNNNLII